MRNQECKRYFYQSLLLSGFLLFVGWLLSYYTSKTYFPSSFYVIILLFFIITNSVHILLSHASKIDKKKFFMYFTVTTISKLFIYLAIMLFYILWLKVHVIAILISFSIIYTLFTALEVYTILLFTKKHNN